MPPSICWPFCANGPENSPTIPTFTTFCAYARPLASVNASPRLNKRNLLKRGSISILPPLMLVVKRYPRFVIVTERPKSRIQRQADVILRERSGSHPGADDVVELRALQPLLERVVRKAVEHRSHPPGEVL